MRVLLYLHVCPCCGVLAARFSNLTKFECSHRRDTITYTHDIFHNKCKRPHHATRKISNLYIENKYHHLTLQKKFRLLLNKDVNWTKYRRVVFYPTENCLSLSIYIYYIYIYIQWSLCCLYMIKQRRVNNPNNGENTTVIALCFAPFHWWSVDVFYIASTSLMERRCVLYCLHLTDGA